MGQFSLQIWVSYIEKYGSVILTNMGQFCKLYVSNAEEL